MMPEWLVEDGIGEIRAVLVDRDRIITALIERDSDGVAAGTIASATLLPRGGEPLPRIRLADGQEAIINHLPSDVSEGATLLVEITRAAIPERDLIKRAVASPAPAGALPHRASIRTIFDDGAYPVRMVRSVDADPVEAAGWSELCDAAARGIWSFPGGILRLSQTPAMLVIDVDGSGRAFGLAMAAIVAAAHAIIACDIGGSIVIDLPTLANKAERIAVAEAFDVAMADIAPPFAAAYERTAINGYGLLQIIRPRRRISLIECMQLRHLDSAALALLRRAERARGTGGLTIVGHSRVVAWLAARPALTAELSRRMGRGVALQVDTTRAIWGGDVY